MPKSTDKKFTVILDTPEYPNLTQLATTMVRKRGFASLGAYIRTHLIAELDRDKPQA